MGSKKLLALLVVALCFLSTTIPAYGYTDPNTIGLMSQILTPLVITAGTTLTLFRRRVGKVFTGLMRRLRRMDDV